MPPACGAVAVTVEAVASTGPAVWPVSGRLSRLPFGEPSPTCATSVPMLAGECRAVVPASGYSRGLRKPSEWPALSLNSAVSAAQVGVARLVPPNAWFVGQPVPARQTGTPVLAGSAGAATSGTERWAPAMTPSWYDGRLKKRLVPKPPWPVGGTWLAPFQ